MHLFDKNQRPRQKLPIQSKTKSWGEKNIAWAENQLFGNNSYTRKSFERKLVNYKLWQGTITLSDMKELLRAHTVNFQYEPEQIQHYPIIIPFINVLLGEEGNRTVDWRVRITNPEAISEVEERKIEAVKQFFISTLQTNYPTEDEFNKALNSKMDFFQYNYQDLLELRSNWLFNHYVKELKVPYKFTQGFLNNLLIGEEIYQSDIIAEEPVFNVLNPNRLFCLMSSQSNKIQDSDVIIYIDYMSLSAVLDTYTEYLKNDDVKKLEDYTSSNGGDGDNGEFDPRVGFKFIGEGAELYEGSISDMENTIQSVQFSGYNLGEITDGEGNFRVLKVYWKSYKKLLLVKFINIETGEITEEYMPETYIINEDLGEEVIREDWVNQAWEGVKIGKDVIPFVRPRRIQYNRLSNPSYCHFGITGITTSYNNLPAVSFLDRLKPYQYLYNVVKERLNHAIAVDIGGAYELDVAKLPSGMDMLDWFRFLLKNKIAVIDSMKEGTIGAAKGKLAGSFNTTGKTLNLSQANFIESNLRLLEYIKTEMSFISGISNQRLGSIKSSETVGGVERSVLQSSYNTEPYFNFHNEAIQDALQTLLDTIVFALKGNKKKFHNIADDYTNLLYTIDGNEISSLDLGLYIDTKGDSTELKQKLDNLAHAAMQNQTISLSGLVKIYNSTSMASIERILQVEEQKVVEQKQQQFEQEMKLKQADIEQRTALNNRQLDILEQNNVRDNTTKKEIELLKLMDEYDNVDYTQNTEEVQLKKEKLAQELLKIQNQAEQANRIIKETQRHNKATESISKSKPINNK